MYGYHDVSFKLRVPGFGMDIVEVEYEDESKQKNIAVQ